ncbi:MAG: hypothetical protein SPI59_04530 [Finegoldia sp.]|nr:hypothetical protein [Finegoldia sp.]
MRKLKKLSVLTLALFSVALSSCTAKESIGNNQKDEKSETVAVVEPGDNKTEAKEQDENKGEEAKSEDKTKEEAKAEEKPEEEVKAEEANKENDQQESEEAKESTEQTGEKESSLTDSEKMELDSIISRMDKMANGTAGASLATDELFADIVSSGSFLETKQDAVAQYMQNKTSDLEDPENFKVTVKALESTSDLYKQDKDRYVNEILPDSGATWDPQISISAFDNLIDSVK